MLWVRLRGRRREFNQSGFNEPGVHEPFEAIYSSASGHLASDGGHFAFGICCVCAAAGVGAAAGGLSDDPGADVLSRGEPGGDGVFGDGAAGATVWADTGAESDDVDELGWWQRDYAAVLAGGVDRRCTARWACRD